MTDESEIKPCWYCGKKPYRYHGGEDSGVECEGCYTEAMITAKEWNLAWGHKRIAELEAQIKHLSDDGPDWFYKTYVDKLKEGLSEQKRKLMGEK